MMNSIADLGAAAGRSPVPRWTLAFLLATAGIGIEIPALGADGPQGQPAKAALKGAVEGQEAPDFALRTLDGRNLRLSEFRGEVVLVNFWATWCSDCREQVTALDGIYEKYSKAGFVLLSVNLDDDAARAVDTVHRLKLSYPVLMDSHKDVARLYEPENLPLTVLVDREGTVRHVYPGYKVGAEKAYLEQVRDLLKE